MTPEVGPRAKRVNGRVGICYILELKECICHCPKWQIHPFISKEAIYPETRNGSRIDKSRSLWQQMTLMNSDTSQWRHPF